MLLLPLTTPAAEVKPSRDAPWSPEESQRAIELDGPYEAQLVAAEPLVFDPVEVCWDDRGRCYVADLIDYPLGGPDGQFLSRIQRLIDDDGDGIYDRAEIFADALDHAQGLLPHRDGLVVTTRTQVLFLRDTDGDGRADERRPLIAGFNPGFSQLQIASPRWGFDGAVYFNNGLDSAEIYPVVSSDESVASVGSPSPDKLNIARHNLRWNPVTSALTPASGFGQYGGGFDDWGRHFSCANRTPVMLAVLPHEALARLPASGLTQGWEAIAPAGAASRVYPLSVTHTTSDAHAGTNTSACGLTVYRGDLMPELRGEIFVCDPTGQLVTRFHRPQAKGASLTTERVGRRTEFFRSRDEWCRPVNLTTGPDGALYVCDIYRRYIDHARFFPDEFAKTHDLRAGERHGRLWRIVPKGKTPRAIEPAPRADLSALVRWLRHENAWQRETAQRLLLEAAADPNGAETVLRALHQFGAGADVSALGKVHFLWTWAGAWSRLPVEAQATVVVDDWWSIFAGDTTPELTENLVLAAFRYPGLFQGWARELAARTLQHGDARARLLHLATTTLRLEKVDREITALAALTDEFDDPWFQGVVRGRLTGHTGRLIEALLAGEFSRTAFEPKQAWLRHLVADTTAADTTAADTTAAGASAEFTRLLGVLRHQPGELSWWKPAVLQGLAEGWPRSQGAFGGASLLAFLADTTPEFSEAREEIRRLFARVEATLADDHAPLDHRVACVPLLSSRPWADVRSLLQRLLGDDQPPALAQAAFTVVKRVGAETAAPLLYEILPTAGPRLRQESVALLASHPRTALELFQRMARGDVPAALVDAETRWHALQSTDLAVKALAEQLFERPSADRAAVLATYQPSLILSGNAAKGREIFTLRCLTCHRYDGQGAAVGPDLSDVRARDKAALLSDILDPNRMVEARWSAYQFTTTDGRVLTGLLEAETAETVVLRLPGGAPETLRRDDITARQPLAASLMPVGLEAGLSTEDMADLLAFLGGG